MQRIWNESELKSMPEWRRSEYGDWMHKEHTCWINASMVGKPIESIMARFIIKDYMIAKEPKEEPISDKEILDSSVNAYTDGEKIIYNQNNRDLSCFNDSLDGQTRTYKLDNMETKKVTLKNGTVLEMGEKYKLDTWEKTRFIELRFIDNDFVYGRYEDGDPCVFNTNIGWLPYTPQNEWKTFLIERGERSQNGRVIMQFLSLEDAKSHYPHAASITEVKLNIEPVNS